MFSLFQRSTQNSISVAELDDILGKIHLIDIREPYEYAYGSIKSAKNIPMGKLLAAPQRYLKQEEQYHIICQSGGRSMSAVAALSKAGYDVINVKGGISSYRGKNRN